MKSAVASNNSPATPRPDELPLAARTVEQTQREDKQQIRDDVCDALNRFNAIHGAFADEHSTL